MNKLCFATILLLLISSCSKEDRNVRDVVIGQWQLNTIELINFQGTSTESFNQNDVIYIFNNDGSLDNNANLYIVSITKYEKLSTLLHVD